MKAILRFDLPEETSEWHDALNGPAYRYALHELAMEMRGVIKHEAVPDEANNPEAFIKATEYWKDRLYAIVQEQDIVGDGI